MAAIPITRNDVPQLKRALQTAQAKLAESIDAMNLVEPHLSLDQQTTVALAGLVHAQQQLANVIAAAEIILDTLELAE